MSLGCAGTTSGPWSHPEHCQAFIWIEGGSYVWSPTQRLWCSAIGVEYPSGDGYSRTNESQGADTFLAMANWHLRFVPDFGQLAVPLRALAKKSAPWVWSDECSQAVHTLKERISSAFCLVPFYGGAKTIVTCDASGTAIGAMRSQVDKTGKERPVAFASRGLSPAATVFGGRARGIGVCVGC